MKTGIRYKSYSGVYPHLAVFNQTHGECGIGAVVAWVGKLWYITYSPHAPRGGTEDKLYELDPSLQVTIRPESVGGTPAGRMIHRESNQLIIGPYFIDENEEVRVVPPERMPGRLTGVCRHLSDPENKIYIYDMEGALYEVDVHSLDVTRLFEKPVPGWHGKGLYKSQGRIVLSNNGERAVSNIHPTLLQVAETPEDVERAGCLAEWDGIRWNLIERRQHTEVTGPGGIFGNNNDMDPIWAMGWDRRSALLKVLDGGTWHRYRLPKASYTYDGTHGWHTEWPRIRRIADCILLMDLHGMYYRFPATFRAENTGGIRPLSSHHQMVVDFCEWNGMTVLACNHSTHFDNPLLGRCQSNLMFLGKSGLEAFGPRSGWGGPWISDAAEANVASEPFLVGGFDRVCMHLSHESVEPSEFVLEFDRLGTGEWEEGQTLSVKPGKCLSYIFPSGTAAEWVRIRPIQSVQSVTAYFHLTEDPSSRPALQSGQDDVFRSIPSVGTSADIIGGIVRPMGKTYPQEETRLQFIAKFKIHTGDLMERQYIVDQDMILRRDDDSEVLTQFKTDLHGNVEGLDFGVDTASIWIEEDGKRYRLPRGDYSYDEPFDVGWPRGQREVITERSVLNAHGSFYEIPRESSGGVRHMRPICTHNRSIVDFCTWRGLLTLVGISIDAAPDEHCVRSEDGAAGLWFGAVDDLWKLGKPVGKGGPWCNTAVAAGETSDPYLMTGYDRKTAHLSHDADISTSFTIEIDATGYGDWTVSDRVKVNQDQTLEYPFQKGFSAHWVRIQVDRGCRASAQFEYE